MKINKFNIFVALCAFFTTFSYGETFDEALKNGKVSGDFSIRYEQREADKEVSTYYRDSAYLVGSFGLNYQTASFYNFSAKAGVRTYTEIWEKDRHSNAYKGIGDASDRFYEEADHAMLSNLYLAYDTNKIHIKAGRQDLNTEWMTKIHDAFSAYLHPIDNSTLELIWTKRVGRVYAKEFRPFEEENGKDGAYKAGFAYKFNDSFQAKTYYLKAPELFDAVGGNININKNFGKGNIGLYVHAMATDEKVDGKKNGEMLETKLYGNYEGYNLTLGYVRTGKENGWGSANTFGESIIPFEEADGMYEKDMDTIYLLVSKKFGPVSLSAVYGEVISTENNYKDKEFDIWTSYNITSSIKLSSSLTIINADENGPSATDLTQVNATLSYNF